MRLESLVFQFRNAMDKAKEAGDLDFDCVFRRFPNGCCGDTCYLLAEYLLRHGIKTNYVCGVKNLQSHAWLTLTADKKQRKSDYFANEDHSCNSVSSNGYQAILKMIQSGQMVGYHPRESRMVTDKDFIIDITADQFSDRRVFLFFDNPVDVGRAGSFHQLFEMQDVRECGGLCAVGSPNTVRLEKVYEQIMKYI